MSSVHATVLDLSKVFDRMLHVLLLKHKLSNFLGIKTYMLDWIHDFMCNISQTVVLDGAKSGLLPVT